jgi:hypothetical protein
MTAYDSGDNSPSDFRDRLRESSAPSTHDVSNWVDTTPIFRIDQALPSQEDVRDMGLMLDTTNGDPS